MSGALPSKTPVSLLQELCMRRGISPKYDLLQIEGAVHEPTFVYRVTVGEFAGEWILGFLGSLISKVNVYFTAVSCSVYCSFKIL